MGRFSRWWKQGFVAAILSASCPSLFLSFQLDWSTGMLDGDALSIFPHNVSLVVSDYQNKKLNEGAWLTKTPDGVDTIVRPREPASQPNPITGLEAETTDKASTRKVPLRQNSTLPFSADPSSRLFTNFSNNLARGANIMTSISGCHIAAWVYYTSPDRHSPDCVGFRTSKRQVWEHRGDRGPLPDDLFPYDTVYVHKRMLPTFVKWTLPYLQTPIVLLMGSYENSKDFMLAESLVWTVLGSPMIAQWFCTNIEDTLLGVTPLPSKLHPMPLGIEPFGKSPKKDPNPVVILRDALLRHAKELPNKTIAVFEAYTSPHTNPNRESMPRGTKMLLPDYLEHLAKSKFVLSPNGHRPDCFRHYEALAFGAIPITELDRVYYAHLEGGPVVFNNRQWWNLTEEQMLQELNLKKFPEVNRNMIFEEYWMDYMERVVGKALRWFDIRWNRQSTLNEFYLNYQEIPRIVNSAWKDYSNDSEAIIANFKGGRAAWKRKRWPPEAFDVENEGSELV